VFELVETAKHAISTLYGNSNDLPESPKVVDVTPTKAEKTIQKRAEMESEHIREFGDFAIPEIIGNGKINLIGNVIENYISGAKGVATQYNIGCMISLIIIIVVIGSLVIISKIDAEGETLL
jgi:hypothetical protein